MNERKIKDNWQQLKGQIRKEWGNLTDNDIDKGKGDIQQLIGTISERSGTAKEKIEEKFDQMVSELRGNSNESDSANAKQLFKKASKNIEQPLEEIQQTSAKFVQQHPLATLSIAGLIGVLAGVLWAKS